MIQNVSKTSYLSIKEIAEFTGVSTETLKKRCQRSRYTYKLSQNKLGGGKSGQKYEILVSSLEKELQEKIYSTDTKYGDRQEGLSCLPAFSLNQEAVIPDSAKKIALAKVDVLSLWQDYRINYSNKKQADNDFVMGFNSGIISNPLFNILDKVSKGSLYRWQKTLSENNGDYTALINNYNYKGESILTNSLTDEEKLAFINIYYNDAKFNLKSAYNILKFQFEKDGKAVKSEATYRRFINFIQKNHNDVHILARDGEKKLKDTVAPYLRRDLSSIDVGDALVADGNKLDFQVLNPFTGKPCRAIWIVFYDWISKDVAGSEIMLTENTQAISSALRNAILRLGKIPKYVYLDNGGAFKSQYFTGVKNFKETGLQGVYKNLGITVKFAQPYNGRAKVVERFFGEFVKSCPPAVSSYIGNSIENRPAHLRRNEEFHKNLHQNDKIPTIEQAKMIIESWLEYYRTRPCKHVKGRTIGEAFNDARGTGVDIDMLDELMMSSEIRTARRNTIRMFNQEYETTALYGKTGKFVVKYSLFDISKIKIYSLKGEYIGEAKTVVPVNALARETGSTFDIYTYRRKLKEQKALIDSTKKKTKALINASNPINAFNSIEWAQEKTVPIKNRQSKRKLEITIYEDLHKVQIEKRRIEM